MKTLIKTLSPSLVFSVSITCMLFVISCQVKEVLLANTVADSYYLSYPFIDQAKNDSAQVDKQWLIHFVNSDSLSYYLVLPGNCIAPGYPQPGSYAFVDNESLCITAIQPGQCSAIINPSTKSLYFATLQYRQVEAEIIKN